MFSNDNDTNSVCKYCKQRFNATLEDLLICSGCGKVCHQKCHFIKNDHTKKCHYDTETCNTNLTNTLHVIHESQINIYSKQKYIDITSLKKTTYCPTMKDYLRGIFFRAPYILYHFAFLYIDYIFGHYTKQKFKTFMDSLSYGLNINSKIIGKENLDPNVKVIYVSNHVSFHDVLTIPRHIETGTMASISTLKQLFAKIMSKYENVLFVARGDNNKSLDVVTQINQFVDKNGNILICPQGLLGKYNSITKFRTSAFRTNYPVQPIVLKYKQDVSSMNIFDIFLFERVDVELHVMKIKQINDNETPEEFANRIRNEMANECNLLLSNVDSRDIKD